MNPGVTSIRMRFFKLLFNNVYGSFVVKLFHWLHSSLRNMEKHFFFAIQYAKNTGSGASMQLGCNYRNLGGLLDWTYCNHAHSMHLEKECSFSHQYKHSRLNTEECSLTHSTELELTPMKLHLVSYSTQGIVRVFLLTFIIHRGVSVAPTESCYVIDVTHLLQNSSSYSFVNLYFKSNS